MDAASNTGRSTSSWSRSPASQLSGNCWLAGDCPKPGKSMANTWYPAAAKTSSVPICCQVADEKLAPWSRTTGVPPSGPTTR